MNLLSRSERTYEVLLYTLPGTRYGLEQRWFNIGPFAERLDAHTEYELLCSEFEEASLVVIVMIASVHDDATGLYRDRILEARGLAPLIRRERMVQLSATARKKLIAATAPYRRQMRAGGGAPVAARRSFWPALAACLGGVGALSLLLWATALLTPR